MVLAWRTEEAELLWARGQRGMATQLAAALLQHATAAPQQLGGGAAAPAGGEQLAMLQSMLGGWLAENRHARARTGSPLHGPIPARDAGVCARSLLHAGCLGHVRCRGLTLAQVTLHLPPRSQGGALRSSAGHHAGGAGPRRRQQRRQRQRRRMRRGIHARAVRGRHVQVGMRACALLRAFRSHRLQCRGSCGMGCRVHVSQGLQAAAQT